MSDADRSMETLLQLVLPKRYEVLEQEAKQQAADIAQIVYRVDAAATRVDDLLRQVRDGGVGRFELFVGKSGSGKTTFLKTLPKFFSGIRVREVDPEVDLARVAERIRTSFVQETGNTLWILQDRDNLVVPRDQAREFFESLRVLFRQPEGKVVVVWPITDPDSAQALSEAAWAVGRDSVVDLGRGLYEFEGLPKSKFYEVGDTTCRSLNRGQSLEAFGISPNVAGPLAEESETISEYYTRLEKESWRINQRYSSVLKDKAVPRLWILVAGDQSEDLDRTIANLTQGTESRVDIDRICEYLDNEDRDAAYLKPWKHRRDKVAYLMRLLDVRLFALPPNAALAAARAFADDAIRGKLKKSSGTENEAVQAISNTRFFRALQGEQVKASVSRRTADETAREFLRLQQVAAKEDKSLNKALGSTISKALESAGISATVTAERSADDGNLTPDILVRIAATNPICLEPTWRTTGAEIPGELDKKQNTLTPGHIQQYLLQKVMSYVEDLDL